MKLMVIIGIYVNKKRNGTGNNIKDDDENGDEDEDRDETKIIRNVI